MKHKNVELYTQTYTLLLPSCHFNSVNSGMGMKYLDKCNGMSCKKYSIRKRDECMHMEREIEMNVLCYVWLKGVFLCVFNI